MLGLVTGALCAMAVVGGGACVCCVYCWPSQHVLLMATELRASQAVVAAAQAWPCQQAHC